jgi:hypothetical protein
VAHWSGLTPAELVREAVAQLAGISLRHERYLRAVVLISGVHPDVQARGRHYVHELAELFAGVVLGARDAITHADPERAVLSCFSSSFSTTILRLAYGPAFTTSAPVDDAVFVADLAETAVRYLLGTAPG